MALNEWEYSIFAKLDALSLLLGETHALQTSVWEYRHWHFWSRNFRHWMNEDRLNRSSQRQKHNLRRLGGKRGADSHPFYMLEHHTLNWFYWNSRMVFISGCAMAWMKTIRGEIRLHRYILAENWSIRLDYSWLLITNIRINIYTFFVGSHWLLILLLRERGNLMSNWFRGWNVQ